MFSRSRSPLVLAGALLTLALAGCTSTGQSSQSATPTVTVTATAPVSTPSSATPASSCEPSSGATAAAKPIAALPLPAGLESAHWDAANADYSGYSACAALSWSVVTVVGYTASSPYAILLFHDGRYLGTATAEQYGFEPQVSRTGDDSIAVTYVYPQGSDSDADPTGRAQAAYRYDEAGSRVVMTGNTPPAG